MADIKLIIKMPKDIYKDIIENGFIYDEDNEIVTDVIKNGTPLPKACGKLIDANALLTSEKPKGIADDVWKESHIYKLLSNAPTIIEADK